MVLDKEEQQKRSWKWHTSLTEEGERDRGQLGGISLKMLNNADRLCGVLQAGTTNVLSYSNTKFGAVGQGMINPTLCLHPASTHSNLNLRFNKPYMLYWHEKYGHHQALLWGSGKASQLYLHTVACFDTAL